MYVSASVSAASVRAAARISAFRAFGCIMSRWGLWGLRGLCIRGRFAV